MSYPDDERNPWKSLADLLISKTSVAALAGAIEAKDTANPLRTWDRFGRMVDATGGDANDLYSRAHALDLLALVYKSRKEAEEDICTGNYEAMHYLEEFINDYEGPLVKFGWPSDECPDFEKHKPEYSVPGTVKRAGRLREDDLILTKERKSLETIIRVLLKEAKMPTEPYKAGKIISELTTDENGKCEISQNCVAGHLKRIQDQTDTR